MAERGRSLLVEVYGVDPDKIDLIPHGVIDMPFVETLEEAAHFRKGPQVYEGQLSPWQGNDALLRR